MCLFHLQQQEKLRFLPPMLHCKWSKEFLLKCSMFSAEKPTFQPFLGLRDDNSFLHPQNLLFYRTNREFNIYVKIHRTILSLRDNSSDLQTTCILASIDIWREVALGAGIPVGGLPGLVGSMKAIPAAAV